MVVAVDLNAGPRLGAPELLFEKGASGSRYGIPLGDYDVSGDGERFYLVAEGEPLDSPSQLVLVQSWFEELEQRVPTRE